MSLFLRSAHGELKARVFVEDGEQTLGVELKLGETLVGNLRINEEIFEEARGCMLSWLTDFGLDEESTDRLVRALREEHQMLLQIKREGMSPSLGWLGSSCSRRLHHAHLCAFV